VKFQDVKETFRILSYRTRHLPHVLPNLETEHESFHSTTRLSKVAKPNSEQNILPSLRGEIESVNMTYVIALA